MPDFSARWTTPSVTEAFEDGDMPLASRLNPRAGHPHRAYVITAQTNLVAQATVGGTEGPMDAALGGRLFSWHWVQWPGYPTLPRSLPVITSPAGQSSVANVASFPYVGQWRGLWVLCCRRVDGGAVMLPLSYE